MELSSNVMPEDIGQGLENAILQALSPQLNLAAGGTKDVMRRLLSFAIINDSARTIVIDAVALIQAVLGYGSETKVNSAAFLWEHLRTKTAYKVDILDARFELERLLGSFASGYSVELDERVAAQIIPDACEIALLTVERKTFDLRHLVASLILRTPAPWQEAGVNWQAAGLHQARVAFFDHIRRRHGPGENIRAWELLVDHPPEEIGPLLQKSQAKVATKRTKAATKGVPKAPPILPKPAPIPPEFLPLHTDDPATVDKLGRETFARVVADGIVRARAINRRGDGEGDQAFIIHMHGPWGSGKSSILNFIRDRLENGWVRQLFAAQGSPDRVPVLEEWLVVDFNAWRNQRLRPPWWSVMTQIERAFERKAFSKNSAHYYEMWLWMKLRWLWMRLRFATLTTVVGIVMFILAAMLGLFEFQTKEGNYNLVVGLTAFGTLLTTINSIRSSGRSLFAGSDAAAKAHAELISDPYAAVVTQFDALVRRIPWPIVVFVDDLDRCEGAYVCELLETIQTMLRSAPITYLISADRKWICSSFEKRYADFAGQGATPGRPLGYQFLDKIFQISVNLPAMSAEARARFWQGLIDEDRPDTRQPPTTKEKHALRQLATDKLDKVAEQSHEQLTQAVKSESDPALRQALQEAVAVRLTSETGTAETEHRLIALGLFAEPNPRAMKRLINAVDLNRARAVLEGRLEADYETIARWTMLELRWPILSDWIAEDIARINRPVRAKAEGDAHAAMLTLLSNPAVENVIGRLKDKGRLTPQSLVHLLG